MPRSAIATGKVDHVVPLRDIPLLVGALTEEEAIMPARRLTGPHMRQMEPDLAVAPLAVQNHDRPGQPSVFTCPACHGTLWEADEDNVLRFRCRVGHIYSVESMLAAQIDEVDRALWVALRTLEERAALAHRLAERGRQRQHHWVDKAFTRRGDEAEREAGHIRALLRARSDARHALTDEVAAAPPAAGAAAAAEGEN
jgi:two-component system chemotaxis response regulator CheB